MNYSRLFFLKSLYPLLFIFLFFFSCLLSLPVYASTDTASKVDLWESRYLLPEFPADALRPYHFIAYYPDSNRYLLVQLDREMVFDSSDSVSYRYYMNLSNFDFKLYEWVPGAGDVWSKGSFFDGSSSTSRWYGWIGFGDCPASFSGGKRILYSNFSVVNSSDYSIMYYRTPFVSGLSWQWAFSNLVQQVFTLILPFLKVVCISLLSVFCLIRLVKKVFYIFYRG